MVCSDTSAAIANRCHLEIGGRQEIGGRIEPAVKCRSSPHPAKLWSVNIEDAYLVVRPNASESRETWCG